MRRPNAIDLLWVAFAAANLVAMSRWPAWETIPFHFIWVSLTLLYGFRVWRRLPTALVLLGVCAATSVPITLDIRNGDQLTGELTEVPLMSAMFLAMVWHARRRQQAVQVAEAVAENRARLLHRQEQFLHDVSHELRTPVTIARGHLELLGPERRGSHDLTIALDELTRIERIINRLLLLAKSERPDFLTTEHIDVEAFVEDVFMRWSEVAPRVWRLGSIPNGVLAADEEALRTALDALLENAVKHTEPHETIELRARAAGRELVLEVVDGGHGIPAEAVGRIFDRFAGLGLAIVDAIARAHGGRCTVKRLPRGVLFALALPGFEVERRSLADLMPAQPA